MYIQNIWRQKRLSFCDYIIITEHVSWNYRILIPVGVCCTLRSVLVSPLYSVLIMLPSVKICLHSFLIFCTSPSHYFALNLLRSNTYCTGSAMTIFSSIIGCWHTITTTTIGDIKNTWVILRFSGCNESSLHVLWYFVRCHWAALNSSVSYGKQD